MDAYRTHSATYIPRMLVCFLTVWLLFSRGVETGFINESPYTSDPPGGTNALHPLIVKQQASMRPKNFVIYWSPSWATRRCSSDPAVFEVVTADVGDSIDRKTSSTFCFTYLCSDKVSLVFSRYSLNNKNRSKTKPLRRKKRFLVR